MALTGDIPDGIQSLLREAPKNGEAAEKPTTAVFYSISNCQEGLRGISFGNFLIKQVVEDLVKERASLKTFVTLSPVPRFASWLDAHAGRGGVHASSTTSSASACGCWTTRTGSTPTARRRAAAADAARRALLPQRQERRRHPVDPVARFHLGNGARLERINWQGDISAKGLREAHGLMVNYRYELKDIEKNHEAYENEGVVAASRQVHALLKAGAGPVGAQPVPAAAGLRRRRSGQGKARATRSRTLQIAV